MKIHPRLACGIFTYLYSIVCIFIYVKTEKEIFKSVWTYIVYLIFIFIVYAFFLKRFDGNEEDI